VRERPVAAGAHEEEATGSEPQVRGEVLARHQRSVFDYALAGDLANESGQGRVIDDAPVALDLRERVARAVRGRDAAKGALHRFTCAEPKPSL
jgi:hypothetical protein